MRKNAVLAKWRAGEQAVGGWLSIANTHTAEMMANFGFDWICVDMQHGLIDYNHLLNMLPAISTTPSTPFVRVSRNDSGQIMKVLDAGAMGVIVPLVNTPAEAAAAAGACRYPPLGYRSFGPIRAALYAGRGYAVEANDEIACIVMIETREALSNIDAIVTTPGVTAVYIGPSDLALSLGLSPVGDTEDATHISAVQTVLGACKRHGVPAGIHTSSPEYCRRRLEMGFDFVVAASDGASLAKAATAALAEVRAAIGAKNPVPARKREDTGY